MTVNLFARNWGLPRYNPLVDMMVMEYPDLFDVDYEITAGTRRVPFTYGMEIEQQYEYLINNPICGHLVCEFDASGPYETKIGVYTRPLEILYEFARYTDNKPWPWHHMTKWYEGCGSHIHFRPRPDQYPELSEGEVWAIAWNTLLDLSYALYPLLVWGIPRASAPMWAGPWLRFENYRIPAEWGRRSALIFEDYVISCEQGSYGCVDPTYLDEKHIDGYRILSLSGTYGGKPVTMEVRLGEVHPLFVSTFVYLVQRIVNRRILTGSPSEFARYTYRKFLDWFFEDYMLDEYEVTDTRNSQWNWNGTREDAIRQILEEKKRFVEYLKKIGPIEFRIGKSFWPPGTGPAEKERFSNIWQLFKTIMRYEISKYGTPYHRVRVLVIHEDCDPRAEAIVAPEKFWEAMTAPPGEFSGWETCPYRTE